MPPKILPKIENAKIIIIRIKIILNFSQLDARGEEEKFIKFTTVMIETK